MAEEEKKSAFIAIVGRPNVGKSSLLNAVLGKKVAIVSPKPQTTRTRILGILTGGATQLVFIDTPGLFRPRNRLGEYMVRSAMESVSGVDACLLVAEAGRRAERPAPGLIERFQTLDMPAVLALNKVDLLADKTRLMGQIGEMMGLYAFRAVVPVSAKTGSGVRDLVGELSALAAPGGHFFGGDALTDQPERVLAAEIVREKLLRLLGDEIPHGAAVVVEKMEGRPGRPDLTDVFATIYCERESHKAVIIGKNGSMLKKIGTSARRDMEKFFECKINLKLWVKVREDWRNRPAVMRTLGYDGSAFDG